MCPSIPIITFPRTQQYTQQAKSKLEKPEEPTTWDMLFPCNKDIHIRTHRKETKQAKPASPYSYREHKAMSQKLFSISMAET
jgi:hypothetical protein